jgi:hypothetical protein
MAAVPCPSCGNKMSSDAQVCPHCGKRRAGAASGGLAGVALSPDELRALVTVSTPAEAPRGILATVVLPHPETAGSARTLELVLTVACLPLVASGALLLGLRRLTKPNAAIGEAGAVTAMALAGGLGLGWSLIDYGIGIALGAVAIEIALLAIRGRIRTTSSRSHRLTAVAVPPTTTKN